MMNHIGINYRHMMNPHYLCLSHHLSCPGDMSMVEKALAKNYKVGLNSIALLFHLNMGIIYEVLLMPVSSL